MEGAPTRGHRAAFKDTDGRAAVSRYHSYLRPGILVLLKERQSHGYELAARLAEMGFDQRDVTSVYSILRRMQEEFLVDSYWDSGPRGGPPRRVYKLAPDGDRYLRDFAPVLVRQRFALGAMLDRYRALAQADPRRGRRGQRRRAGGHALVVDDDNEIRHVLWVLLEERGWDYEEARDTEQALEAWSRHAPDVVVLGDRVSGMDGMDVARRFRREGFDGLMVLCSASIDQEIEEQAEGLSLRTVVATDFGGLLDLITGPR